MRTSRKTIRKALGNATQTISHINRINWLGHRYIGVQLRRPWGKSFLLGLGIIKTNRNAAINSSG